MLPRYDIPTRSTTSDYYPELIVPLQQSPKMSATQAQTKKFQKGERTVPAASEKASKYYPADDDSQPRKVRFSFAPERRGSGCARTTESQAIHTNTKSQPIGPKVRPPVSTSCHTQARCRPHPPRRPFPWQACRPPQGSRPGCPSRDRSLQSQWCSPAKS